MIETLPPIVLEIETPASADAAWAALTEPERVAEWFTDATPVGAVGDRYRLDFGDGSVVEGVIREVEPGRRFAHTWAGRTPTRRQETLVAWSVEPLPERRRAGHRSSTTAGPRRAPMRPPETTTRRYWSGYLDDLAEILAERCLTGSARSAGPDGSDSARLALR